MRAENGWILSSYGFNKDEFRSADAAIFDVSYYLPCKRNDSISIEQARAYLVHIVDIFLKEINEKQELESYLKIYPYTSDLIDVSLYFEDENRIDLGQGIAVVHLTCGKIKYERYEIEQYRKEYPAIGKHFVQYTESYEEALELVGGKTGEAI